MAIAAAQWVGKNNNGITTTATTSGITTRGNLLVALMWSFGDHIGASPITDSKGNTWVQAIGNTGTTAGWGAMYYCSNPIVGASHTFTATVTSADYISLVVLDIPGATLSSVLGQTAAQTQTGTSRTSGSISTSGADNELFVGGIVSNTGVQGYPHVVGERWLCVTPAGGGATTGWGVAARYTLSGESDSFAVTMGSALGNTTAMVAGFKEA